MKRPNLPFEAKAQEFKRIGSEVLLEVARERHRQVFKEAWSIEHDDGHSSGDLAKLACMYANPNIGGPVYEAMKSQWGDVSKWVKHKDRRRDLVRAAALLIAEIERFDRIAKADNAECRQIFRDNVKHGGMP